MVVRTYVCIAKYSKRITLKQNITNKIRIYNTTLLNQDPFLFNITFSKHSDVASIPYFKTSPRLKIRSKFVNQKKNQNFAFNKCIISRTKFLMLEFFRFKDAHLQFRASTTFKYFPSCIKFICVFTFNFNWSWWQRKSKF